ncbi:MAG: fibronectin type III domain-containing protein [Hormoscilla sp.]
MTDRLQNYRNAKNEAIGAQAAAAKATASKDEALVELIDSLQRDLRYAENEVNYNDEKLKLLGWSGRAKRYSEAPGQVRNLEASRQEANWVFLNWKRPRDGGRVTAYKVQRRLGDQEDWMDVTTALGGQITLTNEPRGEALEYRIVAINVSGEGTPSNTVGVVL